MVRAAVCIVALAARIASADPEAEADAAFRAAQQRAASGDRTAIDAFEQLGARAPVTRWTDDAWAEAARFAERAGDLARARRAHERVIAIARDPVLVRRAKAALARLGESTWDGVAREHERLVGDVFDGGDPREALETLEALARANPRYPRAVAIWLVLAQAWEREGEADTAIELLRDVLGGSPDPRLRIALIRIATRRAEIGLAEAELERLAETYTDRAVIGELRERFAVASRRAWLRRGLWLVLAIAALGAAAFARRTAGSWPAVARAFRRPPAEAIFLVPVAGVLVAVALTGNPLIAKALVRIAIAGIAVAWISGALLELQRPLTTRRMLAHSVIAIAVMAAAAYLAIDRDRMLDLVGETLEHGPIQQ